MSNMNNTQHTIIILSDGETWGSLEGCEIMVITEQGHNKLCEDVKPCDLIEGEDFLSNSTFQIR